MVRVVVLFLCVITSALCRAQDDVPLLQREIFSHTDLNSNRNFQTYANGIATTDLHLEQYVTLTKTDTVWIINTGTGSIDVTNITSTSADFTAPESFVTFVTTQPLPITLASHDSMPVIVQFDPNGYGGTSPATGRRNYKVDFKIDNSTGTPITSHFTGRGHGVDIFSHIDTTYYTFPNTDFITSIIVDSLDDTLGLASIHNFVMEMVHFRRTVAIRDSVYDTRAASDSATAAAGGTIQENVVEDEQIDPSHVNGEQGYLELNYSNLPTNILTVTWPYTLLNLRFHTLNKLDTGTFVYFLKNFLDSSGTILEYVFSQSAPGRVRVDTIVSVATPPGALPITLQVNPNPTTDLVTLQFNVPKPENITIDVYDVLGRLVLSPWNNYFLPSGNFWVELHFGELIAGDYFIEMKVNGSVVAKQRFVKW